MTKKPYLSLPLSLSVLSLFLLSGCFGDGDNQNNQAQTQTQSQTESKQKPAQEQASKTATPPANPNQPTYRVFSEQSYVPFIMQDMQGGTSGFEYDILTAIAQKQGFNLTYSVHTWDDLLNTLDAGTSDIISAGLTITDERKQKMDFTDSHLTTEAALLTKQDKNIQNFSNMLGKTIAVQSDTTQNQIVQQYQRGNGTIKSETTAWLTINGVLKGSVDGALSDLAVLNYYVKQYPNENLVIVRDDKIPKEELAFAIKKGNESLKSQLNQGLAKIKADGTYQQIVEKWFGKQETTQNPAQPSK